MCCWFWGIKTSKGEGDIHRNAQRVHVMSFILLLNWSYSGKTNVITAEKISVLTRSFGVLFQLRGGRDVRNSFWWQKTYTMDCVCTSGFWASYNETDCIISTTWGEVVSGYFLVRITSAFSGKKDEKYYSSVRWYVAELSKLHIEKAQVQTTIQEPRTLWWWKFKRCWLLTSTTCRPISSFRYSCQHPLKLHNILCTYFKNQKENRKL